MIFVAGYCIFANPNPFPTLDLLHELPQPTEKSHRYRSGVKSVSQSMVFGEGARLWTQFMLKPTTKHVKGIEKKKTHGPCPAAVLGKITGDNCFVYSTLTKKI